MRRLYTKISFLGKYIATEKGSVDDYTASDFAQGV